MDNAIYERIAEKLVKTVDCMAFHRSRYIKNPKSNVKKNLSERQFHILCTLAYSKKNTVSELAQFMNISKSTLSIIMSKMTSKDLIKKAYPDECDDKRRVYFSVTEKGRAYLDKFMDIGIENSKYFYSMMTEHQKVQFVKAIDLLSSVATEKDLEYIKIFNPKLKKDTPVNKMIYSQSLFLTSFIRKNADIMKCEFNVNKEKDGLTRNQFELLTCIQKLKYDTVSKLENFLNSSGSTVSITVSKLVKNGYLMKSLPSDDEDGRIIHIKLTDKGKNALKDRDKKLNKLFFEFAKTVDVDKLNKFEQGLDLLYSTFSE